MEILRKVEANIIKTLIGGKVNILYGARRVGKTFLIKKIEKDLKLKSLWINGEDIVFQDLLSNRSIENYKRLFQNLELLILDEAQAVPNIGKSLKLIIDELPHLKIIASGSSAFDLTSKIGEPLVGRAFWYELFPLAQCELKNHENLQEINSRLEERLIYGSYPELYNLPDNFAKEQYVRNISNEYLLKDILSFEGIRNSSKIFDLLKLISFQIGKQVSLQELGVQLGISKNTVEKYLDLLEKVYVLKKIGGYSTNLRKEISKSSRWFFWDNGIRNAIINDFRPLTYRNDVGELWENYLITERIKKNKYNLAYNETYFWRTYDQQELDYLELLSNQKLQGFEFKWGKSNAKIPKAFSVAYPEASFELINKENYLAFIE